jgi:hypothetical protein
MLNDGNGYKRDTAQRLLGERASADLSAKLRAIVLDDSRPDQHRLNALFAWSADLGPTRPAMAFTGQPTHTLPALIRSWAVRLMFSDPEFRAHMREFLASEQGTDEHIGDWLATSDANDDDRTHLQYVIGVAKLDDPRVMRVLVHRLAHCGDDPLIPQIVWQNLHPMLPEHKAEFLELVKQYDLKETPNLSRLMPRVTERLLDQSNSDQ